MLELARRPPADLEAMSRGAWEWVRAHHTREQLLARLPPVDARDPRALSAGARPEDPRARSMSPTHPTTPPAPSSTRTRTAGSTFRPISTTPSLSCGGQIARATRRRRHGRNPHGLRRRRARRRHSRQPLPWSPGSTTSGSSRRGRSCRRGAARISPPAACSRRGRSTGSCRRRSIVSMARRPPRLSIPPSSACSAASRRRRRA